MALNYTPFRQNVDDLLSQNEGGVVHDVRMLYVTFIDCKFSVIEQLGDGS